MILIVHKAVALDAKLYHTMVGKSKKGEVPTLIFGLNKRGHFTFFDWLPLCMDKGIDFVSDILHTTILHFVTFLGVG